VSEKQIILGTAGHIDHGKTSLIKALTGINTDRLKEEQERGITIELGFAYLDLPGGQHLGIVDVPGHEKFVKNMVAGATGIDIVAMVIAADEGVMPQTREHMEICMLLGIRHGFVALTKTDLVDEEWLELVTEDIRTFVKGSFLDGAPIVAVSAATGQGLDRFQAALAVLCDKVPPRQAGAIFRLPVDRVFTMKGFGTVITGTLASGRVLVGDTVMLYPSGLTAKVRGIQVHNTGVNEAVSGMRTAINFQGLDRDSVLRGHVLSMPGALKVSYMIDVHLHYLASNPKPLKHRTRVRFHTGTSEVLGIIALLEAEELAPGRSTVAQVRLDEPVALVRDDRFVIRSYSPVRTIGGGTVLNPIPPKHKAFRPEVVAGLQTLAAGSIEQIIDHHSLAAGVQGLCFADLKLMTNLADKPLDTVIQALLSRRTLIVVDRDNRVYVHGTVFEGLRTQVRDQLTRYHGQNPLKAGMPKEELKSKLPPLLDIKLFALTVNQMVKDNQIVTEEDTVRLAGHKIALKSDQSDLRRKIIETYRQSGLQPPYFKDLAREAGADPSQAKDVLNLLVAEGVMVKVKEDLYFHAEAINGLRQRLVDYLAANGEISTPQFKDMTGISRKYVIPLIEHFDAKNVTIRIGDIRKLRKGA